MQPSERSPAPRVARFAASIIDAALYALAPLIPFFALRVMQRPADHLFDEAGQLIEPFSRELATTPGSKLAVASLIFPLLIVQWISFARSGQTIGQLICGTAMVRSGGQTPGFIRSLGRWLFLVIVAAPVFWWLRPESGAGAVDTGLPVAAGLIAASLIDGLVSLLPGATTLRDRLFGLRSVLAIPKPRAFEAPRFSSVGFVTAIFGSALALGFAWLLGYLVLRSGRFESTDIDVPTVVAGFALPIGLVGAGAAAAYFARRFLVGELGLMALLVGLLAYEAMLSGGVRAPPLQQFTQPGMLDWSVYSLGAYFGVTLFLVVGSSLGFMVSSDQGADFSTRFERLVALRHLRLKFSNWLMLAFIATLAPIVVYGVFIWPIRTVVRLVRGQAARKVLPPTVFMSLLTIVGVMFGVTSLNVVLGVMGGFERDLKDKILGTNAHALLRAKDDNFTSWRDAMQKARSVPGVAGATPFLYGEVMITHENRVSGAMLKGIDPETIGQVTDLKLQIEKKGDGKLSNLVHPEQIPESFRQKLRRLEKKADDDDDDTADTPDKNAGPLPGIVIGREMANGLNVWIGDELSVMNPLGEMGPTGPIPRSMTFRVAAIFVSGFYEYDAKFVYINLPDAQKFFRVHDSVTGLELRFTNVDDARPLLRRVRQVLGLDKYVGQDWGEMNANLFSALRLERVVMFVLLSFQVLIACICVIATLVMLVIEKRKEVATLKSMGAREGSIMKLFVLEGLMIGGIGTFYGSAAGYFFCKLIEKFGVGLNAEVYYIDRLPVVIEPLAFVYVALVAMVLVFVATIYPARRGGSIAPVEGFRDE